VGGVATFAQGSGIDAAELHRLTAGNPFFVAEVLHAGSDALPASVRDAVLARTRTLSTSARDALEVAALIGSRMQSRLLVSLLGDPLVVDELISHGLLIKDGDDLRFRHEIARVAIEAAIPPYRKAAIHTKIMDGLLSRGCNEMHDWRSMLKAPVGTILSSAMCRGPAGVPRSWRRIGKQRPSLPAPYGLRWTPISALGPNYQMHWHRNLRARWVTRCSINTGCPRGIGSSRCAARHR
jgi:hypothetical protein